MVWTHQWSYKVDGVELNDHTQFESYVPDLDNGFDGEIIWVPLAGDVPWFVRVQPNAGRFNFLVAMHSCDAATYATRLAILKPLFAPGAHEFIAQARGADTPKTYTVIASGGWMVDYVTRRFAAVVEVAEQV